MSNGSTILTAFNDHFMEFLDDIIRVFPNDSDILASKNSVALIRKANPRLVIQIWNSNVVGKYRAVIEEGNIDFFINKDYSDDLVQAENSRKIIEVIDRIRNPVKMMTPEDQAKTMKYIQNLTKLSTIYASM
jgi:hypothetical protein|uniref:Uncharacterized protein n=1 Tax=viral metagenome TaxID=1070528 RepID=A0A6C0HE23_9ZZZZ